MPILIAQRCSSNFLTSPTGRLCLPIACLPGRELGLMGPGGGLGMRDETWWEEVREVEGVGSAGKIATGHLLKGSQGASGRNHGLAALEPEA